jgi:hypothetical protein
LNSETTREYILQITITFPQDYQILDNVGNFIEVDEVVYFLIFTISGVV